jgi:hypothetical protein
MQNLKKIPNWILHDRIQKLEQEINLYKKELNRRIDCNIIVEHPNQEEFTEILRLKRAMNPIPEIYEELIDQFIK